MSNSREYSFGKHEEYYCLDPRELITREKCSARLKRDCCDKEDSSNDGQIRGFCGLIVANFTSNTKFAFAPSRKRSKLVTSHHHLYWFSSIFKSSDRVMLQYLTYVITQLRANALLEKRRTLTVRNISAGIIAGLFELFAVRKCVTQVI